MRAAALALIALIGLSACQRERHFEDLEDRIVELEEQNALLRDELAAARATSAVHDAVKPPLPVQPAPMISPVDPGGHDAADAPLTDRQSADQAADAAADAAQDAMAAIESD